MTSLYETNMRRKTMDNRTQIIIPVFEKNSDGSIEPNMVFHRPSGVLHSRCIEYPFAASQLGNAQQILDVGTVKSNHIWISWLENLPIDVHVTDYDVPSRPFAHCVFRQSDVRSLPYPDNFFDKILAVSVIEHIGLENPQVVSNNLPISSAEGDIDAVKELLRVLKPGGHLVMTFPLGLEFRLIHRNSARTYNVESLRRFNELAQPLVMDYYELWAPPTLLADPGLEKKLLGNWVSVTKIFNRKSKMESRDAQKTRYRKPASWVRIPMHEAKVTNIRSIEGILCGVWQK